MTKRVVAVNEKGRRIGETHPRAKLSDHEVDLIRDLAEGVRDPETDKVLQRGMTYEEIAQKFEVSWQTVRSIVKCRRRGQTPADYRTVEVPTLDPADAEPYEDDDDAEAAGILGGFERGGT